MEHQWKILYAESVVKKDIPALDYAVKQRIRSAIENKLAIDPYTFGKPLRYSLSGQRSFRVGDYRILFALDMKNHEIRITVIGHRRDIYED